LASGDKTWDYFGGTWAQVVAHLKTRNIVLESLHIVGDANNAVAIYQYIEP